MRSQAARLLPNYAADKCAPLLLGAVQRRDLRQESRRAEKKAIFTALVQLVVRRSRPRRS
jgi:hypothetical protein